MDVEGWVLAGGRSLRMGRDKARVKLAGRTLLEHMLGKLEALGVRASVAGLREPVDEVAARLLPDSHADTYPECGPLSGIETALSKSEAAAVLVVGVDLPLLETEFLGWMVRRAQTTGAMATIPRLLGEPQPLCAVYRRDLLGGITEALESGDYKVMVAVERASSSGAIDFFDTERLAATNPWRSRLATHWQFMNCNTPEDLAVAEAVAARTPIL
jgi:molybdopterin-guanine dinucleotide biosynthesis protein A